MIVLAQIEVPPAEAPGELATTLGQILSWARYGTLWAGGLAVLVSALVWAFAANTTNYDALDPESAGSVSAQPRWWGRPRRRRRWP